MYDPLSLSPVSVPHPLCEFDSIPFASSPSRPSISFFSNFECKKVVGFANF